jgi:hypothetical protein
MASSAPLRQLTRVHDGAVAGKGPRRPNSHAGVGPAANPLVTLNIRQAGGVAGTAM